MIKSGIPGGGDIAGSVGDTVGDIVGDLVTKLISTGSDKLSDS